MSTRLFSPGKQVHLREHAHPGHKHKPDMSGTVLDDAVESTEIVTVLCRQTLIVQHIQNGFVVLVNTTPQRACQSYGAGGIEDVANDRHQRFLSVPDRQRVQ